MAAARGHFNLTTVAATTTTTPTMAEQGHMWGHSPVPYLFGGLAAMLGLIAFALFILACSYWRLSGYFNGRDGNGPSSGERDLEAGDGMEAARVTAKKAAFEEKVLVIMAGEKEPRYLATPMSSSRSSSFGESSSSSLSCGDEKSAAKLEMVSEDPKMGRSLRLENNTYGDSNNDGQ